ncbi:MAG TPA: transglycosylase SLT domain-containing protein [Nitrospira sp.]|nr:transglycosylase SLT domain-containing protein [Nitrospira sp.]
MVEPIARIQRAAVSACILIFGVTLLYPADSRAQVIAASSAAPEASADDEDLDANLVPLEPELTLTPPDFRSVGEKSDQADDTAESSAAADQLVAPNQPPNASSDGAVSTAMTYNIPVVIDPTVEKHIYFFNTSIRSRFEQWLLRFSRYRPLVENIFSEFDLPSDLVNLSLVESGFNPYAYSRAKATGPWQFMKGTGKLYGLRIDRYVDERRDPIKSTVAAARYLRDLYDLFGTWPLAMAAYNAGEGKVMRALHKAQAQTFSDISKTKLIRLETKQYVPRIMAATVIAKNPDRYGFSQDPQPAHQFEEVIVTRPLHFRAIANTTGIPYEELRLLNPELRRDATPPGDPAYHLKVPVGSGEKVVQLLDRVPTYKFPHQPVKVQQVKAGSQRWYRVRAGDTLEKVSKRFRVPLRTLKARNNLSGPVIKPGEFLIITR